ncbi:glycosyltransferase [Rhizobium leguminosarum bv. viciae]|uniref:Glycosyltransferase n=2 Tax=Rhizobium/Agrobacterium group TaxID=227290 RepID=A0A4R0BKC2_RHILV|nr:glycosyltransferase family 4 protein [Rhizobium leguminosarum]ASR09377.1 glycosyl transferase [Rhizobium leguminosarum bv. viciae]MBY5773197.1 glycosyltransferase family 4 protein [Rhizobium leguminosarum]MBY5781811.1 glycosyltransferase family 4 protein [Rhizobium leguminosarum]MBY5786408.1 glycosyltransferase family 4 protein [Rhizobium leguminosarum]MBY5789678.1 glycosyltransferase family 4 protein [Rhizobium leguminosarum]
MRPSLPEALRSAANVGRFPGSGTTKIDRVVIIDDYSAARGGATALAVLSAKLFRGLDIPVTYICGDDAANAELVALGVLMVGLNSRDLLSAERAKAFVTGIHNGAAVRMVANWIAANDTANTVYHVHGWHQILSPAIFRALMPVARRCVVHAHDFFTACPNGAFFDYQAQEVCLRRPLGGSCIATACDKRSYSHKLWRVARGSNILRRLKDQADFGRIILLHEKMASFLVGAGYRPERLTTIRNPVAPLSIKRIEAEANDEFVFIGRLDEEKGIEDAVAATRKAGVRLCVIGDGPLMSMVAASGDHVRAVGWQSHAEIGPTIRKARALLMPSRYPEPFGLVAIEAARSGLPVIMSRSAFLAEEMQRAGMAIACDTADESAFADTLTRFSQMPRHEVRAMSERAFLKSPDLASTHEEWRDALLSEYHSLISTNAVPQLTDGVAIQGVLS